MIITYSTIVNKRKQSKIIKIYSQKYLIFIINPQKLFSHKLLRNVINMIDVF